MIGNNNFLMYALLMLIAGLGIPVMAALNGGLGLKLQNPALATTILFMVGGLISGAYLIVSGNLPKSLANDAAAYQYLGGAFVAFYILSITWAAPRFGVGNAIAFVLLGQLISMALIDHFKLLGAPLNPINGTRLLGLVLMVAGVFLAVRRG